MKFYDGWAQDALWGPKDRPSQLWLEAVRRGFLEEVMPELCFRGTFQADPGPAWASGRQTVPRSLPEGCFLVKLLMGALTWEG